MWITLAVIFFVQAVTQFLLHYFAFIYRGKKDRKAVFYADNDKLEFAWTIIPVIVLSGLILYGLYAWNNIMHYDEEEEVMYVEVYAKQFGWDFRYGGDDNVLGKANVRFIEGINVVGVDMSDPNAQDDVMSKELRLPVGKKVVLKFRSQDVLHSAYFPHFRAQMNVVPGMVTEFQFTPTQTTAEINETEYMVEKVVRNGEIRRGKSQELEAQGEEGLSEYSQFDFYLLCNKICGVAHYNMQMKIVVETEEEFNEWLSQQGTFGESLSQEELAQVK